MNTKASQRKKRNRSRNLDRSLSQSELHKCIASIDAKPTCRRGRVTILEKEAIAQDTEEALKKKEMEAEERRKQSHDLVAESIKRELAESR